MRAHLDHRDALRKSVEDRKLPDEELRLKVAEPNRDMGRTLAIGALVMFLIVITTVVTIVYAL